MSLADAQVHKSGNSLHVTHGDDSGLYVEFYMQAEHRAFLSEKEGYPVYEDVPFIKIMFPGNTSTVVDRPVKIEGTYDNPSDAERFPKQWAAFKSKSVQVNEGLPIDEYPPLSKSMAMTLKSMNIHTVQMLAAVNDNALTWLGAREMREKAKAYLELAKDSAASLKLQADNLHLKDEIAALKQQFAELSTEKRRGRPPREVEEDATTSS